MSVRLSLFLLQAHSSKHLEPHQLPKLRGGAREVIKKVDCDDPKVQSLVSLLRSLDLFSLFSNHKLCKLEEKKTEENLCHFCLVRSLVLRCQSFKGRTSFKPNELLAVLKNEVLPDSPISGLLSLIQHVSSFI